MERATGSYAFDLKDYVSIARPDHWFKNIFMLPGFALAVMFVGHVGWGTVVWMILAVVSTCLAASANYVINEWRDAEYDRHHPEKKFRPAAAGRIRANYVYLEYLLLSTVSVLIAYFIGKLFLFNILFLLVMGLLYNVPPYRTKDKVYLDVLSESINNPIRLMLGWTAIVTTVMPPISVILAYWMGGAFLMAVKRYAEYRHIGDPLLAGQYRRSFEFYDEQKLLVSSFFYAISASFFLAVFLIKYRIELLLTFPLFSLLFAWYMVIANKQDSAVQHPETLYKERRFISFVIFLGFITGVLFFVDIPGLKVLVSPMHIDH